MQELTDYQRGFRDATRGAVEWLHRRAKEMNDPRAKDILNTAAFNLGVEARQDREAGWYRTPFGHEFKTHTLQLGGESVSY